MKFKYGDVIYLKKTFPDLEVSFVIRFDIKENKYLVASLYDHEPFVFLYDYIDENDYDLLLNSGIKEFELDYYTNHCFPDFRHKEIVFTYEDKLNRDKQCNELLKEFEDMRHQSSKNKS